MKICRKIVGDYNIKSNLDLKFDVFFRKQYLNIEPCSFTSTMNELKNKYHLTKGMSTKFTRTLVKIGFVYPKRERMETCGSSFCYTANSCIVCKDEYLFKVFTPNTPTYKALQDNFKVLTEVSRKAQFHRIKK